jgi:hypothetical protein
MTKMSSAKQVLDRLECAQCLNEINASHKERMLKAHSSYVVKLGFVVVLLVLSGLTQAQQHVTDATAMPPGFKVDYPSPIRSYQGFSEPTSAVWKEANDLVGRIGGWRAYARESRDGASVRPAGGSERDDPHAGHGESQR